MDIDFLVRVSCMTYNHAPYIEDAMNGFCMQETSFPFVCTIVDDASTDGEQEVIKKYLKENFDLQDKSIVRNEETDDYVLTFARHKTNTNCYFAVLYLKYNHYRKKSKAPYIQEWIDCVKYVAICEGDDYWTYSLKLQKQADYMQAHDDCVLTHTRFDYLEDGALAISSEEEKMAEIVKINEEGPLLRPYILDGNKYHIQTMTVVMRNDAWLRAIEDIKDYAGKFQMGDTQLWVAILSYGKIHFMKDKTAIYRLHQVSETHGASKQQQLKFALSCADMRLTMSDKYDIDAAIREKFKRQFIWTMIEYNWYNKEYYPVSTVNFTLKERMVIVFFRLKIVKGLAKRIHDTPKIKSIVSLIFSSYSPFKIK